MEEEEIINIFRENGALLKGHFKLSSGLHSGEYLQCALVLQHPGLCERLSKALVAMFEGVTVEVVIGPALGGMTLAYEVARQLNARGIFAERESGKMVLRRGFRIVEGEDVLVVEDVLTTGGSVKEVVELVKTHGGRVVGVGCIIDRSCGKFRFEGDFKSLVRLDIKAYEEKDCPYCKKGLELSRPGSRPVT